MNQVIRKNFKLTSSDIKGLVHEIELAGNNDTATLHKRLTLHILVEDTGRINGKFVVYDHNDTPIKGTALLSEAVDTYNHLPTQMEKTDKII